MKLFLLVLLNDKTANASPIFYKVDIPFGASQTARILVFPWGNLLLLINHTSIRLVNSSCLPYPFVRPFLHTLRLCLCAICWESEIIVVVVLSLSTRLPFSFPLTTVEAIILFFLKPFRPFFFICLNSFRFIKLIK